MTKRLIEEWLPIAALGVESLRERTPMTPFPAPNRLHVWWARRPLVASRAAILAALLPADTDHAKFTHMLGIHGDPVAAKVRIAKATRDGVRLGADAYGYPRTFSYSPSEEEKDWFEIQTGARELQSLCVLDPTAGGGSIPLESVRLGLQTTANDLNPVASLILKATVEWPVMHGRWLKERFEPLGREFAQRVRQSLAGVFPDESVPNTRPDGYLWARTIHCPYCDGLIPLSPNWRLAPNGTGVRLRPDSKRKFCAFDIVGSVKEHSEGTITGGKAKCPYPDCGRTVDGDEVKRQAQAGRMGEQLYTVVYKRRVQKRTKTGRLRETWERGYRSPLPSDDNSEAIASRLAEKLPEWMALDIVPTERIPPGLKTNEPIQYGMLLWSDLFSPRQLLCHGTSVEVFREMLDESQAKGQLDEVTRAGFAYLSLSLGKVMDYNSRITMWHAIREVVGHTFSEHNFNCKMSYVEMAPLMVGLGYDWAIESTGKCIEELVELARPDLGSRKSHREGQAPLLENKALVVPKISVTCKSADNLDHIPNESVDLVVIDPPYYANVMYAELSDFFYVWLKRTAGRIYPELFRRQLTDKEQEAVANPARYIGQRGAKELADRDYRESMAAIFAECRRVLKPDGVLTLMFTHKATGAWDALTSGLMEAGFTITASWPINTEAEGSLHIKDKSAANSTIFLVCRPREVRPKDKEEYWEDVEPTVRKAVRDKVRDFQDAGISGVDLYLSCFGPALQEFAAHWPLKRGLPKAEQRNRRVQQSLFPDESDPYAVTPEDALDAARREVKQWRLEQLLHTTRQADLDTTTEWFVLAWDAFKAPAFPYDEALRLARVVGVDLDRDIIGHLAEKKGSDIILWDSAKRAAKGALGGVDGSRAMVDALHHAAYRVRSSGLQSGRDLLEQAAMGKDQAFIAALTAVLEVLPVGSAFTKVTGETGLVADAASDFDALEHLRRLMFSERIATPQQLGLWEEAKL
ncbi:MAG: DUF1156 domain-containing protein [Chloroflexi bacterium]|nr:DUF1156 domain-containing protein [Chloroflexota bacterium]